MRDLIRKEREAFRAERERTDATLRVEQSEATAAQERLWAETENFWVSMEHLQRRVEGQSNFARGELLLVSDLWEGSRDDYQLNKRAAGSNFVAARFQSP